MDREYYYRLMQGKGDLDYERYLDTSHLLSCQKPYEDLCNHDELMFQIVHQNQELWMKLIAFTLLEVDDWLEKRQTYRVLTLMQRTHRILGQMISILGILETMSPSEYQAIRLELGNGSGQESPGFRTLLEMPRALWKRFESRYLNDKGLQVVDIYHHQYDHGESYMIAEALAEYDELFRAFRFRHVQLIERTIGIESKSLKGRDVKRLMFGCSDPLFPQLWAIRSQMTNEWGGTYGEKRASLSELEQQEAKDDAAQGHQP